MRRIRHSRQVRRRTGKLALVAGSVVLLALAIGLVQLTRSAPQAATDPPARVASAPAATAGHAPALHAAPSAARERRPLPSAPAAPHQAPTKQPELGVVPLLGSITRDLKRDANGKLVPIIPAKELRDQLPRSEGPMKACIERSGQRPTGKATLGFTVAARNNKLVVETTSVQDDETLAGYPELLECMHKTAGVLLPEGRPVPELGTPIYVRRTVRIENGQLVEDSLFNFSYHP